MHARYSVTLFALTLLVVLSVQAEDPLVRLRENIEQIRIMAERGNPNAQHALGVMFDEGNGLSQNYELAVKWYRRAAENGLGVAQLALGTKYSLGQGVPEDRKEGSKWIRKAADQGIGHAQCCMGLAYEKGLGVAQDFEEALKWYRLSAEQGIDYAQERLGRAYYIGEGVPQNTQEAAKWCRKAAEQGNAVAQYGLGLILMRGQGVVQDFVQAHMWLNLAAAQGMPGASENRDELAAKMTPELIGEAQRSALKWKANYSAPSSVSADESPSDLPKAWTGSGFIISDDGYIVTNDHVVSNGSTIWIKAKQGNFSAKVVDRDATNDLALLKIESAVGASSSHPEIPKFRSVAVARSTEVFLGAAVFTIGFPNVEIQGIEPKLTKGEINSLSGIGDDPRFFQTSVQIQPGNSGGPLIDQMGNVIGVVSSKLADIESLRLTGQVPQNVNYAVKSSILLTFLNNVPDLKGKLVPPSGTERLDMHSLVAEVVNATVLLIVE